MFLLCYVINTYFNVLKYDRIKRKEGTEMKKRKEGGKGGRKEDINQEQ